MKKLIMAAFIAVTSVCFGEAANTDVYTFKASFRVPYVTKGVRVYKAMSYTGNLYIDYTADSEKPEAIYAIIKNKSTGVEHKLVFGDAVYNLIGKPNKKIDRPTPTVCFITNDDEVTETKEEAHELIKFICLSGSGSLTYIKDAAGCDACGVGSTPGICAKVYKLSGSATGIMDCECPEDGSWNHTVEAGKCGIAADGGRSHLASFWGTWSATWNKKLSN